MFVFNYISIYLKRSIYYIYIIQIQLWIYNSIYIRISLYKRQKRQTGQDVSQKKICHKFNISKVPKTETTTVRCIDEWFLKGLRNTINFRFVYPQLLKRNKADNWKQTKHSYSYVSSTCICKLHTSSEVYFTHKIGAN